EMACEAGEQCPPSLVCGPDRQCRNQCTTAADCPLAQACIGRVCIEPVQGAVDAGADGSPPDGPPTLWGLSRGTNDYRITAVSNFTDGCHLSVEQLVGMTLPLTYDPTTATISVGNPQGTPPMPS